MEVQKNDDEETSIVYNQFLQFLHISYSIEKYEGALSYVNESQSQSLENFTNQLQENIGSSIEEDTTLKSEN